MTQRVSEIHFAQLCQDLGFSLAKIPRTNRRTADFVITTGTTRIIAEIKEISGGTSAIAALEEIALNRSISLSSKPGKQAANFIKDASGQIASSARNEPTLVVLYSNISRPNLPAIMYDEHVGSDDIDAAMYGALTVFVQPGRTSFNGPCYNIPINGESLASRHRHISAIAVLSSYTNKNLAIYHNLYARVPLECTAFHGHGISHYFKAPSEGKLIRGWRKERQL